MGHYGRQRPGRDATKTEIWNFYLDCDEGKFSMEDSCCSQYKYSGAGFARKINSKRSVKKIRSSITVFVSYAAHVVIIFIRVASILNIQ